MKCPNCGAEMQMSPDLIKTANPPIWEYVCPNCQCKKYRRVDESDKDFFKGEPGKIMYLPDPWQEFRCKAAKDFLAAMLTNGSTPFPHNDAQVKRAIDYADELIKQLKERDEHNNSK